MPKSRSRSSRKRTKKTKTSLPKIKGNRALAQNNVTNRIVMNEEIAPNRAKIRRFLAQNNVRNRGHYNNQGVFVPPVMTHAKMNEYLKEWFPNYPHVNRQDYTEEDMAEVRNGWVESLYKPNKPQLNASHRSLLHIKQRITEGRKDAVNPRQNFRTRKSRGKK